MKERKVGLLTILETLLQNIIQLEGREPYHDENVYITDFRKNNSRNKTCILDIFYLLYISK